MSSKPAAVVVLAAVMATACTDPKPARQSTAVQWSVEPRPIIEIGAGEGEDALFRVTSATRLPDGRIAVANAGTQQVKLFGANGAHLASLGRRGSGPGEFQVPMWVGSHADSILVWDAALERLTVFDDAGRLARTTPFPALGGSFPSVIGTFADGSLLLASGTDHDAAARQEGAWRERMRLVRVSPAGRVIDTLATVPSQERYSYRSSDGMGLVVEDLPFGRRTVMDVTDDGVVLGTGEEYRIRRIDAVGTEHEVLHAPWTPHPVSPRDVEEYWARMVTVGGRSDRAEAVAQRTRIPYPETLPPYESLVVGAGGELWIGDAQPPEGWDDPDLWRIYSPEGAPLATIELPARVRPQAIGPDWILCTSLDSATHRQTVRLYRYTRG
ncbi:MAG TPA: hypothetical protein VF006_09670 [Longimicrobium sp.]